MTVEKQQAFISYTSELTEERKAAVEMCMRLDFFPYYYELEGAQKTPPITKIRDELSKSEVYVGILGGRFGTPYPEPDGPSIIEFELNTFREQRKGYSEESYEVSIFPKDLPDAQIEIRQRTFRNKPEFQNGPWVRKFDSISKLREEVSVALGIWKGKYKKAINKEEEPEKERAHSTSRLVGAGIFGLAILVAILLTVLPFSISSRTLGLMLLSFAAGIFVWWGRSLNY